MERFTADEQFYDALSYSIFFLFLTFISILLLFFM